MENKFTEDQLETLRSVNLDKVYDTVTNQGYAVGISCNFTSTLTKTYKEATGKTLTNWNCNSCVMNNIKKVGELYVKSLVKEEPEEDGEKTKHRKPRKRHIQGDN